MSTRFSSFSVLGIALILIIGGLLVIVDLSLEWILDLFQRKKSQYRYSQLEWKSNNTLQLQRLAYEGIGSGTWLRAVETVPITLTDELLTGLDIKDQNHPRLKPLVAGSSTQAVSEPEVEAKIDEESTVHREQTESEYQLVPEVQAEQ